MKNTWNWKNNVKVEEEHQQFSIIRYDKSQILIHAKELKRNMYFIAGNDDSYFDMKNTETNEHVNWASAQNPFVALNY